MKRKWLMVPLVTGILAAGITGATVLAHNDDGQQESPKDQVAAKVAETLGIDEQALKNALADATQEVRSERLQHRLDDMVEAGRLTQEEADEFSSWYDARPDGLNLRGKGHRLFGFGGGGGGDEDGPRNRFGGRGHGGQRFGGQGFPGQGQLPLGPDGNFQNGNVPEGNGTSY